VATKVHFLLLNYGIVCGGGDNDSDSAGACLEKSFRKTREENRCPRCSTIFKAMMDYTFPDPTGTLIRD